MSSNTTSHFRKSTVRMSKPNDSIAHLKKALGIPPTLLHPLKSILSAHIHKGSLMASRGIRGLLLRQRHFAGPQVERRKATRKIPSPTQTGRI